MPSRKRIAQIAKKKEIQIILDNLPLYLKERINARKKSRKNKASVKNDFLTPFLKESDPEYLNRKGGLITFTSAYDFEITKFIPSKNKANRAREQDKLDNIKAIKKMYGNILHLKSCAKIIAYQESIKVIDDRAVKNESGLPVSLSTVYSYLH
ncbi:MAG: hypothetical protein V4629_07045 [Pseudomonadota bacterium]